MNAQMKELSSFRIFDQPCHRHLPRQAGWGPTRKGFRANREAESLPQNSPGLQSRVNQNTHVSWKDTGIEKTTFCHPIQGGFRLSKLSRTEVRGCILWGLQPRRQWDSFSDRGYSLTRFSQGTINSKRPTRIETLIINNKQTSTSGHNVINKGWKLWDAADGDRQWVWRWNGTVVYN